MWVPFHIFQDRRSNLEAGRSRSILEVNFTNLVIFYPIATFNTSKYSESKINVGSPSHFSGSEVKLGSWEAEVEVNLGGQFH